MTGHETSLAELEAAYERSRRAWEPDKAGEWARKSIDLLNELPSNSPDQVATTRVSVGGVVLPDLLHADLVRSRHANVM